MTIKSIINCPPTSKKTVPTGANGVYDKVSILISTICLIHCVLPVIFLAWFAPQFTSAFWHILFLIGTLIFLIPSMIIGCKKHKHPPVIIMFLVGITVLCIAVITEFIEQEFYFINHTSISVLGVSLIVIAHILNLRQQKIVAKTLNNK